jgi:acetyl esterase/lipase
MIRLTAVALVLGWICIPACAQNAKPALQPLWPGDAPGAKGKDALDVPGYLLYPAPADKANGTAIVVCPGGGYGALAMDHEGYQIAAWLNSAGVTAVIVKYRLGPRYQHPVPHQDAQRALRTVRFRAKEWGVDPQRVGILGFSAGGHLASTVGTHFEKVNPDAPDPIDRLSDRPDFMVLMYPVITLTGPHAHVGSRNNLLGKNPDPQLVDRLCNDKMVTPQTPPTFLVHTTEDKGVPPENSVLFYLALTKAKVPAEMHIFEKGRHGLGLGPKELPYSSWPGRCLAWMQSRGLLERKNSGQ